MDSFIIVVLLLFLTITQLAIANAALANDISATAWVFAIFVLLDFITIWAYYIVFELVWNGQSPGKRLTKLRVMQAEGRPVTLTGSMLRNLVRFIDFCRFLRRWCYCHVYQQAVSSTRGFCRRHPGLYMTIQSFRYIN